VTAASRFGLPVTGVVLVAAVLGVQVARGGGDFAPLRPADPCAPRVVTSQAEGIDGLTERLVLLGVDAAACRLHVTREALTLELSDADALSDAQVEALHQGLLDAVARMDREGSLPPSSDLVDEVLDTSDLNGFVKAAVRALPDGVVDAALRTDDVLVRTIEDLDVRAVLADLDDRASLERQVQDAVTQAARDSLLQRLRDLA
jgi:hypothetical protein